MSRNVFICYCTWLSKEHALCDDRQIWLVVWVIHSRTNQNEESLTRWRNIFSSGWGRVRVVGFRTPVCCEKALFTLLIYWINLIPAGLLIFLVVYHFYQYFMTIMSLLAFCVCQGAKNLPKICSYRVFYIPLHYHVGFLLKMKIRSYYGGILIYLTSILDW